MASRIEDYAMVGDAHTAALVGLDGSVDWLCLPRFDSPACFAAMLGDNGNGRWQVAPADPVREVRRRYRDQSLVLETEFSTDTGTVCLIDAMPPRDGRADLVRRVRGVSGQVRMHQELVMRFGYGRVRPWVRRTEDDQGMECLLAVAGPDALCLRSSGAPLPRAEGGRHHGEFTVRAGETVDLQLAWFPSHEDLPAAYDTDHALSYADTYWSWWASICANDGGYRDVVTRSLLTLKALTYGPTGGIVAAVTTSLPEQFGGSRNWDYRYCWLRDAALTLSALVASGYREEASAWRDWLLRAVAGDPEDVQIMYGVAGERDLPEVELDWLAGYADSKPVRIGNAASEQFQADVLGEVMQALHEARVAGVREDDFSWPLQLALMEHLEKVWRSPDHGLWEIRGTPRFFTHSRAMIWVAFDRAARAVEEFGLSGPVGRWRALCEEVRAEVMDQGFNDDLNAFTQYYGGKTVDAALLTLPSVGFIAANDPRMVGTVAEIEKKLRVGDILVHRYDTSADGVDGLPPGENPFLPCSFWLAEYYALAGRTEQARALLDRLIGLANDVGLYAEEYDADQHRMAGNVPQAFSHLALVHAVSTLERIEGGK
ncbi:MAG TPA: glycoside hydrolase family 15 protein [Mycobacteriales bacterium]|nr:glycoside hydrolase family 15 protein [Mycobacteriales bacterium]